MGGRRRRRRLGRRLGATLVAGLALTASAAPAGALPGEGAAAARPAATGIGPPPVFTFPPTTAQCLRYWKIACYDPAQLQAAYDLGPLYAGGLNGAGTTIAVVDSFGSPTIARDLAAFDAAFGLPAPPSLTVVQPAGRVPPFNPRSSDMVGWAGETTLDVEMAHLVAPGAALLVVETPVSETIGTAGFPQIVAAENYVIDHHLAQVISQSFGCAEQTFPSPQALLALRGAYRNAQAHHVTVLAGSGDNGPTSPSNPSATRYFTHRVAEWPADDPLVTGVGGTQLTLSATGARTAPDQTYNDNALVGAPEAGAGGLSSVFARPSYQSRVRPVVGAHRGFPDVAMSASAAGSALTYMSFPGLPEAGWYPGSGTSEASPLFAGVVALADQRAGHPLGLLNPRLYALAAARAPGLVPVTVGNTTVRFLQDRTTYVVPGFRATAGYNLATGLGTVDAAKLVPELAG